MLLTFALWYAFAAILVIGGMVLYLDRYKKYRKAAHKLGREIQRRGQKLIDFDTEHTDHQALKYNTNLSERRCLLVRMLSESEEERAKLKLNLILFVGLWLGLLIAVACLAIFVP
ncbi:MAG: hypothetical protein AAB671_02210, partial [Patescibacteria group bacterium]